MKTHRNLSHRQEALAERSLCAAVAALGTAEECRAFFRDLCTPAELQAMADRWAVVESLQRSLPYREIHRVTGVSVTTIGRVARFLANGNGGYALAARRLGAARTADRGTARRGRPPRAGSEGGLRAGAENDPRGGSENSPRTGTESGLRADAASAAQGARHA